jgi:2-(1,2-epoxy-1,2-dihydrophenyl)acetyl-CoA isomerase
MGIIKRVLNRVFLNTLEGILEYESQAQPLCLQTKDHKEGKAAFLQKRSPHFKGE